LARGGQLLLELALGPVVGGRHRLVEELDDLVQDVDRALAQQRQQDRVAPLGLPARQGLGRRAPPDRGQEASPLGGQHAHVEGVGVEAPEERVLGQLGLDRRR